MENFRKLAKIAALNQKIPGPVCGNPDCEELCAEAYDAALSPRLDPMNAESTNAKSVKLWLGQKSLQKSGTAKKR